MYKRQLRTDGGLKTGRDIVMAAMMGAEEFGMGTSSIFAVSTLSLAVYASVVSAAVYLGAWDPEKTAKSRLLSI